MPSPTGDPLLGVFPPAWRVGDRWKVLMTIPDEQQVRIANPKTTWVDIEYQFEVETAPEGDEGEYRVAIDSPKLHYIATYEKQPFSFVRLDDRSGARLTLGSQVAPAAPSPYFGGVVRGFITDFPARPGSMAPGKQPVRIGGVMGAVEIAPTADGARWTYTSTITVETFTWSRGEPWWSTLDKRVLPELEAHTPEPKAFSARLLSSTPRDPTR